LGVRRFGGSVVRVGERVRVERGRPAQLHADLPSRRKPSPESRRQQPRPAATGHQTRCWPSWKPSEYAEHVSTFTAPTRHDAYLEASTRHNPGLGIFSSPGSCHPVHRDPRTHARPDGFSLSTQLLPENTLPVDRTNSPRMTRPLGSTPTAPSRDFIATTSRSAGAPRDGTHCLTVQPLDRLPLALRH
jgi:hypothetical protein